MLALLIISILIVPVSSSFAFADVPEEQTVQTIITANDKTEESYQQVQDWINSNNTEQYQGLKEDANEYLNNTEPQSQTDRLTNEYEKVDLDQFSNVQITDYRFKDESLEVDYNATGSVDGSVLMIGITGDDFPQLYQIPVTFDGEETLELPKSSEATTTVAVVQIGTQFSAISEGAEQLIENMRAMLILWGSLGTAFGTVIYSIHFLLFIRGVIENYKPTSQVIKGALAGGMNPIKQGNIRDQELEDDDVTRVFSRYFTVRQAVVVILLLIVSLYAIQAFSPLSLPLPTFNDPTLVFVGFTILTYLFIAPLAIAWILRALFNPDLEYAEEISEDGKTAKRYVAKRGTMEQRYTYDKLVKVDAENGVPLYLVDSIDREEMQAVGAFNWTLSKHVREELEETISKTEIELGEELSGNTVNILEVVTDPIKATYVIKDMVESAKSGQELRANFPLIQFAIRMEEGRKMAEGLEQVLSGSSVDAILARQLDYYEQQEEELSDEVEEIKEELDELDDVKSQLNTLADDSDVVDGGGGADTGGDSQE